MTSSIPGIAMNGACPKPFLPESAYPPSGGYVKGRACAAYPQLGFYEKCCIPCPYTDSFYPDDFDHQINTVGWLNIGGLVLVIFALLSYAVLPVEQTRRHSLNVCLLCALGLMQLGFIVPLSARPKPCHDAITENDITSSTTCAFASGFLIFGGLSTTLWILVRAVAMHLQIVWDISPGRVFSGISHVAVWLTSLALTIITLVISGASFNFSGFCHPNSSNSLGPFWAPVTTFASVSLVFQLVTFIYCLQVYMRHAFAGGPSTPTPSDGKVRAGPPTVKSLASSAGRRVQARIVYRRVMSVLRLQWRSIILALLATFDVTFFCVFFVVIDQRSIAALTNPELLSGWAVCMVLTQDKMQCMDHRGPLAIPQPLILGLLTIFSLIGYEVTLLMVRTDMLTGWVTVFRNLYYRMRGGSRKGSVAMANQHPGAYGYDMEFLKSPQLGSSEKRKSQHAPYGSSRDPILRVRETSHEHVDSLGLSQPDDRDTEIERSIVTFSPSEPSDSTTSLVGTRIPRSPRTNVANPLALNSINHDMPSTSESNAKRSEPLGEPGPAMDEDQVRRNFSRP